MRESMLFVGKACFFQQEGRDPFQEKHAFLEKVGTHFRKSMLFWKMERTRVNLPILNPRTEWVCPNCTQVEVTNDPRPHTRFHACPGLKGLTAPYVVAGTRCKVEAIERQDYVGNELVRYDGDGRPVSFVRTEREDGCDVVAFAATARASFGAMGADGV